MTFLHSYSASYIKSALRSSNVFPSTAIASLANTHYKIDSIRQTENASLLFTRNMITNEHVVMKILLPYKDTRYNLETLRERQLCQLDALQWNRTLTKDKNIYLGLAPVCDPELKKQICIGDIIEDPNQELPDPDAEYALLMEELPKQRRLDSLLKSRNLFANKYYVHILAQFMAHMHRELDELPLQTTSSHGDDRWGSPKQLKSKLLHNFTFVDEPMIKDKAILHSEPFKSLKALNSLLKDRLLSIFAMEEYREYFEKRIREQHIRRCHGDLKARNIWIMPFDTQKDEEPWQTVNILDAVDFNPMYSSIDILSDFAMLVVDVHVRTDSCDIANAMLEEYLHLTKQQDKSARAVLNYYIVEKAFIGAIVNILYDERPELGLAYLRVAKERLGNVKR